MSLIQKQLKPFIPEQHKPTKQAQPKPVLSGGRILTLATGAGLSVASLYYSQPMLGELGPDLNAGVSDIGMVPTLTQLGYALGLLLLAPLGDRHDRRVIILVKGVLLTLALVFCSFAPGVSWLLAASLAVGVAATMAQDILPVTATLATVAQRGKTVGTVMTGLLLGILLSRVVSGVVAEYLGWRVMFMAAAIAIALISLMLWRSLPPLAPTTRLGYPALFGSMWHLWRRYPALRLAAYSQGLLSIGFSAFWSTLAVMLHDVYQLGSATAGAFGLAGAASALAAPLVGMVADRKGPERVTLAGSALATLSFAAMFLTVLLPGHSQLILLVVCAVGFDLGVQATLVGHQTIIYALQPDARSRLNALLFTGMFIGMAAGAALGSRLLESGGWMAVVILATVTGVGSLVMRWLGRQ